MRKLTIWIPMLLIFAMFSIDLSAGDDTNKNENSNSDKSDNAEINWMPLDTAIILAKAQNKHVFIDFKTGWCGYCKKMDRDVFSDPGIIKLVNENFIPAQVDGDSKHELNIDGYKITEKDLSRYEFKVTGYPTYWWLTPDGKKLLSLNGYRPKKTMEQALTYVKDYAYDTTKTETTPPDEDKK